MSKKQELALKEFEAANIREVSHKGERYLCITDVIGYLVETETPTQYWKQFKDRLEHGEKAELSSIWLQLRISAPNGRKYKMDCATVEGMLRIIQSVPSSKPRVQKIKKWLAKVGHERLKEEANPELAVERAIKNYEKQGRSAAWISQRLKGIGTRNAQTSDWAKRGIKKAKHFAILTRESHEAWSGITIDEHYTLKGLTKGKHNLRDHETRQESIFEELAELSTMAIAEKMNAKGLEQNLEAAELGGGISKRARLDLEAITGESVVCSTNYLGPARKAIEAQ